MSREDNEKRRKSRSKDSDSEERTQPLHDGALFVVMPPTAEGGLAQAYAKSDVELFQFTVTEFCDCSEDPDLIKFTPERSPISASRASQNSEIGGGPDVARPDPSVRPQTPSDTKDKRVAHGDLSSETLTQAQDEVVEKPRGSAQKEKSYEWFNENQFYEVSLLQRPAESDRPQPAAKRRQTPPKTAPQITSAAKLSIYDKKYDEPADKVKPARLTETHKRKSDTSLLLRKSDETLGTDVTLYKYPVSQDTAKNLKHPKKRAKPPHDVLERPGPSGRQRMKSPKDQKYNQKYASLRKPTESIGTRVPAQLANQNVNRTNISKTPPKPPGKKPQANRTPLTQQLETRQKEVSHDDRQRLNKIERPKTAIKPRDFTPTKNMQSKRPFALPKATLQSGENAGEDDFGFPTPPITENQWKSGTLKTKATKPPPKSTDNESVAIHRKAKSPLRPPSHTGSKKVIKSLPKPDATRRIEDRSKPPIVKTAIDNKVPLAISQKYRNQPRPKSKPPTKKIPKIEGKSEHDGVFCSKKYCDCTKIHFSIAWPNVAHLNIQEVDKVKGILITPLLRELSSEKLSSVRSFLEAGSLEKLIERKLDELEPKETIRITEETTPVPTEMPPEGSSITPFNEQRTSPVILEPNVPKSRSKTLSLESSPSRKSLTWSAAIDIAEIPSDENLPSDSSTEETKTAQSSQQVANTDTELSQSSDSHPMLENPSSSQEQLPIIEEEHRHSTDPIVKPTPVENQELYSSRDESQPPVTANTDKKRFQSPEYHPILKKPSLSRDQSVDRTNRHSSDSTRRLSWGSKEFVVLEGAEDDEPLPSSELQKFQKKRNTPAYLPGSTKIALINKPLLSPPPEEESQPPDNGRSKAMGSHTPDLDADREDKSLKVNDDSDLSFESLKSEKVKSALLKRYTPAYPLDSTKITLNRVPQPSENERSEIGSDLETNSGELSKLKTVSSDTLLPYKSKKEFNLKAEGVKSNGPNAGSLLPDPQYPSFSTSQHSSSPGRLSEMTVFPGAKYSETELEELVRPLAHLRSIVDKPMDVSAESHGSARPESRSSTLEPAPLQRTRSSYDLELEGENPADQPTHIQASTKTVNEEIVPTSEMESFTSEPLLLHKTRSPFKNELTGKQPTTTQSEEKVETDDEAVPERSTSPESLALHRMRSSFSIQPVDESDQLTTEEMKPINPPQSTGDQLSSAPNKIRSVSVQTEPSVESLTHHGPKDEKSIGISQELPSTNKEAESSQATIAVKEVQPNLPDQIPVHKTHSSFNIDSIKVEPETPEEGRPLLQEEDEMASYLSEPLLLHKTRSPFKNELRGNSKEPLTGSSTAEEVIPSTDSDPTPASQTLTETQKKIPERTISSESIILHRLRSSFQIVPVDVISGLSGSATTEEVEALLLLPESMISSNRESNENQVLTETAERKGSSETESDDKKRSLGIDSNVTGEKPLPGTVDPSRAESEKQQTPTERTGSLDTKTNDTKQYERDDIFQDETLVTKLKTESVGSFNLESDDELSDHQSEGRSDTRTGEETLLDELERVDSSMTKSNKEDSDVPGEKLPSGPLVSSQAGSDEKKQPTEAQPVSPSVTEPDGEKQTLPEDSQETPWQFDSKQNVTEQETTQHSILKKHSVDSTASERKSVRLEEPEQLSVLSEIRAPEELGGKPFDNGQVASQEVGRSLNEVNSCCVFVNSGSLPGTGTSDVRCTFIGPPPPNVEPICRIDIALCCCCGNLNRKAVINISNPTGSTSVPTTSANVTGSSQETNGGRDENIKIENVNERLTFIVEEKKSKPTDNEEKNQD